MYGKWIQSVAAKADNNASNSIKIKSKLSLQFTCKLNAFQDQKGDEMSDGYGNSPFASPYLPSLPSPTSYASLTPHFTPYLPSLPSPTSYASLTPHFTKKEKQKLQKFDHSEYKINAGVDEYIAH
ncbi:hypothetical protein QE152_g39690 [Popillia japonica]|uniref:Uncharacterized protein n=1 Tax=Popillia japonica TaxID=7064 RepID=A0AAW1HTC0_POPJA